MLFGVCRKVECELFPAFYIRPVLPHIQAVAVIDEPNVIAFLKIRVFPGV